MNISHSGLYLLISVRQPLAGGGLAATYAPIATGESDRNHIHCEIIVYIQWAMSLAMVSW